MCFEDDIPLNIYRLIRGCQWESLERIVLAWYEIFDVYIFTPFRHFRLAARFEGRLGMVYEVYRYNAEASAALLAAAFFCLILAFSAYRMYSTRSWFLCSSVIALSMEIMGLLTRSLSILQPENLSAFVASVVLLTLAPSVQAVSLYVLAGRVILRSTPADKQDFATLWFPSKYLTVTFIAQNLLAVSIQLFGVGFFVSAIISGSKYGLEPEPELLQRAMYRVMSFYWLPQLKRRGLSEKVARTIFYVLYLSTVLLMVRTLYRLNQFVAETTLSDSFLVTQEWPFWVFEIFVVALIYASYLVPQYPGRWFERGGPLENDFETATGIKQKKDMEMGSDTDSVKKAYGEFEFGL
ncbi:hypothetical protein TWF481_008448 [Arthrobotrys musiformis]|uniref:Uncharacterized protein n=1 Tax=Arthrobotrys musiformis TaxID=47236 RepID=A0AAV9W757_9PEZI